MIVSLKHLTVLFTSNIEQVKQICLHKPTINMDICLHKTKINMDIEVLILIKVVRHSEVLRQCTNHGKT